MTKSKFSVATPPELYVARSNVTDVTTPTFVLEIAGDTVQFDLFVAF